MRSHRHSFRQISSQQWRSCRLFLILLAALIIRAPIAAAETALIYEETTNNESKQGGIASSSPFPPPAIAATTHEISRRRDDVLLVNSRELGTVCKPDQIEKRLRCERYNPHRKNKQTWLPMTLTEVLTRCNDRMQTVIYVHGNRMARGADRSHGLMVYHSLVKRGHPSKPIRFIIWSWPSAQISGSIHDYRVKAARTGPVGWQLAWVVDRLPAETPVSMVGYSYGARIISGSLHLLGGGQLNGLDLRERVHADRLPMKAVYIAAAFDVNWAQPNGYHGKAFSQVSRLTLVNNRHDPAMRFFHFSTKRQRVRALGWAGPSKSIRLSNMASRIQSFDVTDQVGRSHDLRDYLAVSRPMNQIWQQICSLQPRTTPLATEKIVSSQGPVAIQRSLAEREAISGLQ